MIELSHKKEIDWSGAKVRIGDADFSCPFETGVEYSSPARGPWNIVHTGMLVPESHQIFVCAQSCNRGVVLTAAELFKLDRFSTITIEEHNILDGDTESLIIDGVKDIVKKLSVKPKAILLFTNCIHHFIGCDLKFVYDTLHKDIPDIDITDCYMNPTMRKTLIAPDPKMRQQLYSFLHPTDARDNGVNFIGNNFAADISSEIGQIVKKAGNFTRDICTSKTYAEFQQMAKSKLNIVTNPAAVIAGKTLQERFGTKSLYLPLSYDTDEIKNSVDALCKELNVDFDTAALEKDAEDALNKTSTLLGKTKIAIDYTSTSRPLGLAKLLLTHGMNVTSVYLDCIIPEEKPAFDFLKKNFPTLELYATVHPKMGILPEEINREKTNDENNFTLAIGQKSAYFTGTKHFVNMLEGSGLWGFTGITKLMALIQDAYKNEKDTSKIIQVKGWGCCS